MANLHPHLTWTVYFSILLLLNVAEISIDSWVSIGILLSRLDADYSDISSHFFNHSVPSSRLSLCTQPLQFIYRRQLTSSSLTPILISRFLLNLRQIGSNDDHTEGATAPHSTGSSNMTSVYTSIIGNLGELEHNLGELLEHESVDTRDATESEPDMPDIPLQSSQNFIERPVLLGVLRRVYLTKTCRS